VATDPCSSSSGDAREAACAAVVCNMSSLLKAHLRSRPSALQGSTLKYSKRKSSYVAESSHEHLVVLVWAGEHLSGTLVPFVVKRALEPDCVTRVDVPFPPLLMAGCHVPLWGVCVSLYGVSLVAYEVKPLAVSLGIPADVKNRSHRLAPTEFLHLSTSPPCTRR
jgi:hypothetical protein